MRDIFHEELDEIKIRLLDDNNMILSSKTLNEISSDLTLGFAALIPPQINQVATSKIEIMAGQIQLRLASLMPYRWRSLGSLTTLG